MQNGWINPNWVGMQEAKRRNLRRDANFIGTGLVLLAAFMQLTFSVVLIPLMFTGIVRPEAVLSDPYMGLGNTHYLLLYAAVYTFAMGIPMLLAALFFRQTANPFQPHEKVSPGTAVAGLLSGMAVCIIANFVASAIMSVLQLIGIQQPSSPQMLENTPIILVLNIFVVAVLPALLEEMVFRGYVLQVLRPYGNGLAILVSSLLFGLMHGNVLQIPFAFIVGLVLSYLVVKTNCIWLACGLHFLNNFMSVLLEYLTMNMDVAQANLVVLFTFCGVMLVGLIALLLAYFLHSPLTKSATDTAPQPLGFGQRLGTVFSAPAMIAGVILYVLITLQSILVS